MPRWPARRSSTGSIGGHRCGRPRRPRAGGRGIGAMGPPVRQFFLCSRPGAGARQAGPVLAHPPERSRPGERCPGLRRAPVHRAGSNPERPAVPRGNGTRPGASRAADSLPDGHEGHRSGLSRRRRTSPGRRSGGATAGARPGRDAACPGASGPPTRRHAWPRPTWPSASRRRRAAARETPDELLAQGRGEDFERALYA